MSQSPTGKLWNYPLGSPSPRFTRINNYIRNLGWQYAAFSPSVKMSWEDYSTNFPWSGYCINAIYDLPVDGYVGQGGLSSFNVINTAALDAGLPTILTPPGVATPFQNDVLTLIVAGDGIYVNWDGRDFDPSGYFTVSISIWIGNSIPTVGPAISHFVYQFTAPIEYNVPLLLFPFEVPPPPPSVTAYVVGCVIADLGGVPFVAYRLPLE